MTAPRWDIARLLAVSAEYLAGKGSCSPRLDAELLLAEILGMARVDLYTQYDRPLSAAEVDAYRALVARRARHEPTAYILGRAAFRYLTLEVSPAVLIPRPETEELVQTVLDWLEVRPLLPPDAALPVDSPPRIADVGTGSGAIALSLAREAGVRVLATDTSEEALAVAGRNRAVLELQTRVELRRADLLAGTPAGGLRLVVSNPPYVSDAEYAALAPDIRLFEPAVALRGGPDGLDVYRRLVPQAHVALGAGGALFLEVGETQAAAVAELASTCGFALVDVFRDLAGKERIVRAVKAGAPLLEAQALAPPVVAALRRALERGAVLGVPTDTVYGLAAAWSSSAGVRRVFAAKGRGEERPVAVLFPSVAEVRAALPDLADSAARVLGALLPGPYTFVVATAVPRPPLVGTPDSLGVRVPDHPPLLDLLGALDVPLAATSANLSGQPEAATAAEAAPNVLAHCTAALSLGKPPAGRPSTVVDLRPLATGGTPVVLREGAVPAVEVLARIQAALR
ncbi:MAG: hypothetical protein Kow00122_12630 [Thermoleophilia bacterium]